MNKRITKIIVLFALLVSCVNDKEFDSPKDSCAEKLVANTSFKSVKALYEDQIVLIKEDLVIEGYIISSDKEGNFFGKLYLQDKAQNPTEGFIIELELYDSHLFYELGSKVYIKLKGLYLEKDKGNYKLGGTFTAFGSTSVGRLPASKINEHIFLGCDENNQLQSTLVSVSDLADTPNNILVRINDVEFIEADLGLSYAEESEESLRSLKDCEGNQLSLLNSGYADFQGDTIPEGNGSIVGVLTRINDNILLLIRDLEDVDFTKDRCPELVTEFTSTSIIISEIADPDNNAKARFVELYNAGDEALDLNQWKLQRYTNANTELSSEIDLSGFFIEPKSTVVISPNSEEFEKVYGFLPDIEVGTNSPADSNGDDNLVLVDPFGTIIDIFGVIGEDGTGTNHEFEDGKALRSDNIDQGNATFTFEEWIIYNDTGAAGTINQPQNAPGDFSPAQH